MKKAVVGSLFTGQERIYKDMGVINSNLYAQRSDRLEIQFKPAFMNTLILIKDN